MARKRREEALVISQERLAEGVYDLWLETGMADGALAGQFVCLYTRDSAALLPRPISLCEVDRGRGRIRLVYRVAGRGTEEFSHYGPGERAVIMGPLGNGFPLDRAEGKSFLLMGGGIGIPPMLELGRRLKEMDGGRVRFVLGYRDERTFLREDMERTGRVYIASEDGSVGVKGNVLDAVRDNELDAQVIYACGPLPMLRAVKQYARENGAEAWISLEERMACGVGACLGCVCRTVKKDAHSQVNNARICTEGPVFRADEVEI